jgi:hypothetical protein
VLEQDLRPEFYEEQYLGADDLDAIVQYGRSHFGRHLLSGHTWGISIGLDLTERPSPSGGDEVAISITPGYASDGFGRPIVLLQAQELLPALFQRIEYDAAIDEPDGRLVDVWIRYRETATRGPRPGFEGCNFDSEYSRIHEGFQIVVGSKPNHSDRHSEVTIGVSQVDAEQAFQTTELIPDESIPFQTFPDEGAPSKWLVPIGRVLWKPGSGGAAGAFRERSAADIRQSVEFRRHIGVVAQDVLAADGVVRIAYRTNEPNSDPWSNDLLWVDGNQRVFGSARIRDRASVGTMAPGGVLRVNGGESPASFDNSRVAIEVNNSGDGRSILQANGPDAPYRIAIQDGHGRVSHLWNAYDSDAVHKFDSDGEGASWLRIHDGDFAIRTAPAGGADADISWNLGFFQNDQGDIGIGTTSPQARLHITDPAHLNAIIDRTDQDEHLTMVVGSSGSGLRFSDTNVFFIASQPYGDRANNSFGDEHLRVTSAGRVGIGETNPDDILHISSPNSNRITLEVGNSGYSGLRNINALAEYFAGINTNTSRWCVYDNLARAERLSVLSDGDVGIGTITPGARLDVQGEIRLGGSRKYSAVGALQNFRIIAGKVETDGSPVPNDPAGWGFTSTRNSTGDYTVTFPIPFSAPPVILATPTDPGNQDNSLSVYSESEGSFRVRIRDIEDADNENDSFFFLAIGIRA